MSFSIEDCFRRLGSSDHFKLVTLAAERAQQLMHGAEPKVFSKGNKPTVIALEEIAAGLINFENIQHESAAFLSSSERSQKDSEINWNDDSESEEEEPWEEPTEETTSETEEESDGPEKEEGQETESEEESESEF